MHLSGVVGSGMQPLFGCGLQGGVQGHAPGQGRAPLPAAAIRRFASSELASSELGLYSIEWVLERIRAAEYLSLCLSKNGVSLGKQRQLPAKEIILDCCCQDFARTCKYSQIAPA